MMSNVAHQKLPVTRHQIANQSTQATRVQWEKHENIELITVQALLLIHHLLVVECFAHGKEYGSSLDSKFFIDM
jgi:hypothetical protein